MGNKEEKGIESKLDKLIQDLEYKTLAFEITEQKLREELDTRKKIEKEICSLNLSLQDHATRLSELNKELKSFAYTVSHDIKAPLRGILGYSNELLKRHAGNLSDRPLFCVQQIAAAANNMEVLIEDLLEYSRLEMEIPTSIEVNIGSLFKKLIKDRTEIIAENKTVIESDISQEIIWCWERGFTQVISNLLDNAIKYSRISENPTVKFSCEKAGDYYLLKVADNGIGFDMQFQERIFDLFHRLVTGNEFEGTGAGLAIVKKVIDKMEGKVWAESSPGHGATFLIEIPARESIQIDKQGR